MEDRIISSHELRHVIWRVLGLGEREKPGNGIQHAGG